MDERKKTHGIIHTMKYYFGNKKERNADICYNID